MDFSHTHFYGKSRGVTPRTKVSDKPYPVQDLYGDYHEWLTQHEERMALGIHMQGEVCSFRGNSHDPFVVHKEDMI